MRGQRERIVVENPPEEDIASHEYERIPEENYVPALCQLQEADLRVLGESTIALLLQLR